MNDILRITLVQSKLHWEDIPANLQQFEAKLNTLSPSTTDLIVLPEMFTTGFSMNVEKLAEPMDGTAVQWMAKMAKQLDAVVCGSLIIREAGKFYNRLVWMNADGTFQSYDKRHCFSLAKEDRYFEGGKERLIVQYKGWKICPLICYDLRFPVWSRNTVDYDLLIYVANWPNPRRDAWKTLLEARAIENQAYVIGVNRVGDDGMGVAYTGDSSAIDYAGNIKYQITTVEDIQTLEFSRSNQDKFRQRFGFLADRDTFKVD